MIKGNIFDIKEFAVNDGPGIRTTVFFKGCPLRCIWCHNPEGQDTGRTLFIKSGCVNCGKCKIPCTHEECKGLSRCLHACERNLVSVVGKEWTAEALSEKILKSEDVMALSGGGVTFSGGEPLMQAEFLIELSRLLPVHKTLETCGYSDSETFLKAIENIDLIYYDIKFADPEKHRIYTGKDNAKIIKNLELLKASGKDYLIRIPLIPDITDTEKNLKEISSLIGDAKAELLPYNEMAGAKYVNIGRKFTDKIKKVKNGDIDISVFKNASIRGK